MSKPTYAPDLEAPYLSIAASAGSGKTFNLTRRLLRLLALGAPASSIGAFTFSRKAAGEIFDALMKDLTHACHDERAAKQMSQDMQMQQGPDRAGFVQILRQVLNDLHRLHVGTLDSHISRMLQTARVELGLPGQLNLLDENSVEAALRRQGILDELFHPGTDGTNLQEVFLDSFRLATQGEAEKDFDRKVHDFVLNHHEQFRLHSAPEAWQLGEQRLAEYGLNLLPEDKRLALKKGLLTEIGDLKNGHHRNMFTSVVEKSVRYEFDGSWSDNKPSSNTALLTSFLAEQNTEYYRKATTLSSSGLAALNLLLRHCLAVEWHKANSRTQGIYQLMRLYHEQTQQNAATRGEFSFSEAYDFFADEALPRSTELAFRLDARIDHWLLDEFQDTSPEQWNALHPFVDEVLQDPEQRRTLFYVGDVKQAIYGWRGGTSELFGEVLRQYPNVRCDPLNESYRSCPELLTLVNQVFTRLPVHEDLPDRAVARWEREFTPHEAAPPRSKETGYVCVRHTEESEEEFEPTHSPEADLIAIELTRLLPHRQGLSIAILARANKHCKELAEDLRRLCPGFRFVVAGKSPLRDNSAVEALLAWFELAAHPGHTLAQGIVDSSPLADQAAPGLDTLRSLQERGLTETLTPLCQLLSGRLRGDYAQNRLQQLLDECAVLDRKGWKDPNRILAHLRKASVPDVPQGDTVQIMTIHASKGLGFDVVFLPVRASDELGKLPSELVFNSREPDEVQFLPSREVCDLLPESREILDRIRSDHVYEGLCVAYVAMTRAKREMQLILPPSPKKPGRLNRLAAFLRSQLDASTTEGPLLYEGGTPDWMETRPRPSRATPRERLAPKIGKRERRLKRVEPSAEVDTETRLSHLFKPRLSDGRRIGQDVHEALETLEWFDEHSLESLLSTLPDGATESARAHLACLAESTALRQALSKPTDDAVCWRERSFEIVWDNQWISGVFDRVVFSANEIWIQDFKTNHVRNEKELVNLVEHYRPQMSRYRDVLADMLELNQDKIFCELLFTSPLIGGERVRL